MSFVDDYPDEMHSPKSPNRADLDEQVVERLLAGRVPSDRRDLDPVAAVVSELRATAEGTPPAPSRALADVFAAGTTAVPASIPDVPAPVSASEGRRKPARGRPKPRSAHAMLTTLALKFSSFGIGVKAAIALLAAGAIAGGAMGLDLHTAVADVFDRSKADTDAPASESVPPDDAEFGLGVADEATDDEESGVDGLDISERAREQGQGEGEDDVGTAADDETANDASGHGRARATGNTEETPAEIPATVGPGTGEEMRSEDPPVDEFDVPPNGTDESEGTQSQVDLPETPAEPETPVGESAPPVETPGQGSTSRP